MILSQKNDGVDLVVPWVFKMITFFTNFMFPSPEQHSSCRYTIPIDTLVFDFDMPQVVVGGCGHVGKRRVSWNKNVSLIKSCYFFGCCYVWWLDLFVGTSDGL